MNVRDFFAKPQVQVILVRLCGASGLIGTGIVWFCGKFGLPVPDVNATTMVVTWMATEAIEWVVAWYRNNPNNILRRMAQHINGPEITEETKAQVVQAVAGPGSTEETKAQVVKAVERMPDVATVVVKDEANGALGTLAQSGEHPNIVTETQNEADAKLGTKVPG